MKSRRQRPQATLDNVLLALALVGLAFSALLLAEYQSPGAVCSVGSGCDAVRTSAYSSIAGISLPALGIAYFLLLTVVALAPGARAALVPLAEVGGVAGVVFVGIQALVIGAFCSLCLVVDAAAIGAAVVALMLRGAPAPRPTTGRVLTVVGLAVLALASPALVQSSGSGAAARRAAPRDTSVPIPDFVAREQQQGEGVTVVEFVDFECPACRAQHGMFKRAFARTDVPVRMVYLHLPLSIHEHAVDAARAYICAEDAGYGPQMADALFATDDLSPRGLQAIAEQVGIDPAWYGRCLMARSTAERLERDLGYAQRSGTNSLPTFWIGENRYVGVTESAWVLDAIERAAR